MTCGEVSAQVGSGAFTTFNEMPLNEMPLNKMPLNEMPLNEMSLNEMPFRKKTHALLRSSAGLQILRKSDMRIKNTFPCLVRHLHLHSSIGIGL